MPPARIAKSSRAKAKQPTGKQANTHHWESFSSKVAKLHALDPLRKVRRYDLDAESLSLTTSYFRNCLDKWSELNISQSFRQFRRVVSPWCDSLTQIVHYEAQIMQALDNALSANQQESLEPLLELLTAFAHDLGARFESFYGRSLELITLLANQPQDADVVEWTFGALAFLFKYLAKLIVPDLRPTYDKIAVLLGKGRRQPGYIVRVTAEALSFLVKKAATPAHRQSSLTPFLLHIRKDLVQAAAEGDRHFLLYRDGLMTMFSEAMKGPGDAVHSNGPALLAAMIRATPANENRLPITPKAPSGAEKQNTPTPRNHYPWTEFVSGILTSIIHHASATTMEETVEAIYAALDEFTEADSKKKRPECPVLPVTLLGVLAGTRKGDRLKDWSALVSRELTLVESIPSSAIPYLSGTSPTSSSSPPKKAFWNHIIVHLAITWQQAPIDALIPCLQRIAKLFAYGGSGKGMASWFLPFIQYYAVLDSTRVRSLFAKPLQTFLAEAWSVPFYQQSFCALLPRLVEMNAIPGPLEKEIFAIPPGWQQEILQKFESFDTKLFDQHEEDSPFGSDEDHSLVWSGSSVVQYAALLRMLESCTNGVQNQTKKKLANQLLRLLHTALTQPSMQQQNISGATSLLMTDGLQTYLRLCHALGESVDVSLRDPLHQALPRFRHSVRFLESTALYEARFAKQNPQDQNPREKDWQNLSLIVESLSRPSHELRLASIRLLQVFLGPAYAPITSLLETVGQIEELPLEFSTVRAIAMHSRKLGKAYLTLSDVDNGEQAIAEHRRHDVVGLVNKIVLQYLFGMLTFRLTPVWDHAIEALEMYVQRGGQTAENAVTDMTLKWLRVPSQRWTPPSGSGSGSSPSSGPISITDFQCVNMVHQQLKASKTWELASDPAESLSKLAGDDGIVLEHTEYEASRARALKIFNTMPSLAEHRSSQFVPLFLEWAHVSPSLSEGDNAEDDGGESSETSSWSMADRKSMLRVLGQFQNPRGVPHHERIYLRLLSLLENGDTDLQRLTLHAIFAYKHDAVKPFRETLENLLDEKKFKTELVMLLQGSESLVSGSVASRKSASRLDDASNGIAGGPPPILAEHRPHLMPILLRLLYGRTITRSSSSASSSSSLSNNSVRLAVLRNLSPRDLGSFITIALGSLQGISIVDSQTGGVNEKLLKEERRSTPRHQIGLLNMMLSLIRELGASVSEYATTLLNAILYCLVKSTRLLDQKEVSSDGEEGDIADEEEEQEGEKEDEQPEANDLRQLSQIKVCRSTALKCLNALCLALPSASSATIGDEGSLAWFAPYAKVLVSEAFSSRIDRFALETTQSVSSLLQLLGTWTTDPTTTLYLTMEPELIPQLTQMVAGEKTKDSVKVFVLEMIQRLAAMVVVAGEESIVSEPSSDDAMEVDSKPEAFSDSDSDSDSDSGNKKLSKMHLEDDEDEDAEFTLQKKRRIDASSIAPLLRERIRKELLEAHLPRILSAIAAILGHSNQSHLGSKVLDASIETLVSLAPVADLVQKTARDKTKSKQKKAKDEEEESLVTLVLDLTVKLLQQSPKQVNFRTKGRLLVVVEHFVPLLLVSPDSSSSSSATRDRLVGQVYEITASLFSFFKDRVNRLTLCRVLETIASYDTSLAEVAVLCRKLNAFQDRRVDQPDYNVRLEAFSAISRNRTRSAEKGTMFTARQWLALLHNLIFYVRFEEEYGILSSNSADGMRRFIADIAFRQRQEKDSEVSSMVDYLSQIIMPCVYSLAREAHESVRREGLRVLGYLVARLPDWEPITDLRGLATARSEEANEEDEEDALVPSSTNAQQEDDDTVEEGPFFFHILSPAAARQAEAFQLLRKAHEICEISSHHLAKFFLPLLEHFIYAEKTEGADALTPQAASMGAEAALVAAHLSQSLTWTQFRPVYQRYISYIVSRPKKQRQTIRLLNSMADVLVEAKHLRWGESNEESSAEAPKKDAEDTKMEEDKASDDESESEEENENEKEELTSKELRRLARTLPTVTRLTTVVNDVFLPPLLRHIHEKDESEVSHRVPAAVAAVKLVRILPDAARSSRLASVLTDISHILRSRAIESRDQARTTLAQITAVLGPEYFGFVLDRLRGALQRGYMLHVLSYTVHSLLISAVPVFPAGSLDYCLEKIMAVILDDTFGVSGQEKEAEDYKTSVKEIRVSRSQDSLELMARSSSVRALAAVVRPLQQLLVQKITLKMVRKLDELFARLQAGLLHNPAVVSGQRDVLVFCYEIIQEHYRERAERAERKKNGGDKTEADMDPRVRKYLVAKGSNSNGYYDRKLSSPQYDYKIMRFALDMLRTVIRKNESLRSPASLHGFVPILGDAVTSTGGSEEEVRIAALKILTTISKVPLVPAEDGLALYKVGVKEAVQSIAMSPSTQSELAQAGLKLISTVLHDRRDIPIRDEAIDLLLSKLRDDLTDPQYRNVTFHFVRAVLQRQIQSAAVYDILDHVGTIMVTNPDQDTRSLARGAFYQFVRDYPQTQSRWSGQLDFLVANLQYDGEGGRLSVLEVIHLLLRKTSSQDATVDRVMSDVISRCFLPLVFVLANDASEKCRKAAAELLRVVFLRAKEGQIAEFLRLLRSWLANEEKPVVAALAIRVFTLYFAAMGQRAREEEKQTKRLRAHTVGEDEDDDGDEDPSTPHGLDALLSSQDSKQHNAGLLRDVQLVLTYLDSHLVISYHEGRKKRVYHDPTSQKRTQVQTPAVQWERLDESLVSEDLITGTMEFLHVMLDQAPRNVIEGLQAPVTAVPPSVSKKGKNKNNSNHTTTVLLPSSLWHRTALSLLHASNSPMQLQATRLFSSLLALFASRGLSFPESETQHLARLALWVLGAREVDVTLAEEIAPMVAFLSQDLSWEDAAFVDQDVKRAQEAIRSRTRAVSGNKVEQDIDEDSDSDSESQEAEEVQKVAAVDGDEEEDGAKEESTGANLTMPRLLHRISFLFRREVPATFTGIQSKLAALHILEAICRRIPKQSVASLLDKDGYYDSDNDESQGGTRTIASDASSSAAAEHYRLATILLPLLHLTDPNIPTPFSLDNAFKQAYEETLRPRVQVLLSDLQATFGTRVYTSTVLAQRQLVRRRREHRAGKRKIEAVAQPAKHAAEKKKKVERKKDKRRERGKMYSERRHGGRTW